MKVFCVYRVSFASFGGNNLFLQILGADAIKLFWRINHLNKQTIKVERYVILDKIRKYDVFIRASNFGARSERIFFFLQFEAEKNNSLDILKT